MSTDRPPAPLADIVNVIPPPGAFPCFDRCGTILDRPGVCDLCATADARREQDRQLRPALESISPEFRWATFDAPEFRERCPIVAAIPAVTWRKLLGYRSILLVGTSGKGKTSLAVALIRDMIDAGRFPARVAEHQRAALARFFTARAITLPNEDGPPWRGLVKRASVAVIDDAGQEAAAEGYKGSERAATLAEMLFERHDAGSATIVTTSHRADAWVRMYGDGARRRFWSSEDPRVRVIDLDAARKG
jgi:hypothetical protein